MKRHIKVKATYDPHTEMVEMVILEQTHIRREFGPWGGSHFFHGKVDMGSALSPCAGLDRSGEIRLWCRGTDKNEDSTAIKMSLEHWAQVKEAIEAYNEWGATQ